MPVLGTIVNGKVVLDEPSSLPEGSRVTLLLEDDDEDFGPPPMVTETHAEFLASLRESMDDVSNGRVYPAEQVLRELAARHNLPYSDAD